MLVKGATEIMYVIAHFIYILCSSQNIVTNFESAATKSDLKVHSKHKTLNIQN